MRRFLSCVLLVACLPVVAVANSRCANTSLIKVGSSKGCPGIFGPLRTGDGLVFAAGQFQMVLPMPRSEKKLDRQAQQLCRAYISQVESMARAQAKLNSDLIAIMQVWGVGKPRNGITPTKTWTWLGDRTCRTAEF